jgi:hypothetical protein
MADHRATWVRLREVARQRFPDDDQGGGGGRSEGALRR